MHLFCLTLITVVKFGTPLVPHFLIVSRNYKVGLLYRAIVGRKNEHGQSELALTKFVLKFEIMLSPPWNSAFAIGVSVAK
jgi:hypothetical protein